MSEAWNQGTVYFVTQTPNGSPTYHEQICWNVDRFIEAQTAAAKRSLNEADPDKRHTFAVVSEREYREQRARGRK